MATRPGRFQSPGAINLQHLELGKTDAALAELREKGLAE